MDARLPCKEVNSLACLFHLTYDNDATGHLGQFNGFRLYNVRPVKEMTFKSAQIMLAQPQINAWVLKKLTNNDHFSEP